MLLWVFEKDYVWLSLFDRTQKIPSLSPVKNEVSGGSLTGQSDEKSDSLAGDDRDEADDPLTPLYPMIESLCESSLYKLKAILKDDPCPLGETENLSEQVNKMQKYIDGLAPPSAALDVSGKATDSNMFWVLMYAAWHYRLNEDRFNEFARSHGWEDDVGKAEDALGNLVLHSLQSLEIRFLWSHTRSTP